MNLLPKSHEEFSQTEYWNIFFKKRGKSAFEWYGEYPELCEHLHKYIKSKDDVLMVGCGNSKLSADLYDVGFKNITNIDISSVAIKQMTDSNKMQRPDMKFIQMDALNMAPFKDGEFSVVLDKGTLDALMSDDSDEKKENIKKYFGEINRVTKLMGRYVCISLLQEHILIALLDYFPQNNWMFRVVRCLDAKRKTAESSADIMPVFIVVATKFKQLPQKILELSMGGDKMQRLPDAAELQATIQQAQKAAMICNGLHRGNIADYNEISLDLFRPDETIPRFTVHVVDQKSGRGIGKFAAFIVPQGRETDWLFSTKQGRRKLLSQANFERLAIVSMHRGQLYTTWDDVKDELGESIINLAPQGLKAQIPYLSLGSEVGQRETIYRGTSEYSGDFIVEEITGEDSKIFRRLVFLSNQFVIQSEALVNLKRAKGAKNKKPVKVVDPTYLACQHHLYMTIGVRMAYLDNAKKSSTLVIGLGGGGLCTFIQQCLRNVQITAVELDASMLQVATEYFGLKVSDNLKVVIQDGIAYLEESAAKRTTFDSIIFDVDNKISSVGISCPPVQFLSKHVINLVKSCLTSNGIFILNLVCRDEKLLENLVGDLKESFKVIYTYQVEEELNQVLYCTDSEMYENKTPEQLIKLIKSSADDINYLAKKNLHSTEELICVDDFLKELKI